MFSDGTLYKSDFVLSLCVSTGSGGNLVLVICFRLGLFDYGVSACTFLLIVLKDVHFSVF